MELVDKVFKDYIQDQYEDYSYRGVTAIETWDPNPIFYDLEDVSKNWVYTLHLKFGDEIEIEQPKIDLWVDSLVGEQHGSGYIRGTGVRQFSPFFGSVDSKFPLQRSETPLLELDEMEVGVTITVQDKLGDFEVFSEHLEDTIPLYEITELNEVKVNYSDVEINEIVDTIFVLDGIADLEFKNLAGEDWEDEWTEFCLNWGNTFDSKEEVLSEFKKYLE